MIHQTLSQDPRIRGKKASISCDEFHLHRCVWYFVLCWYVSSNEVWIQKINFISLKTCNWVQTRKKQNGRKRKVMTGKKVTVRLRSVKFSSFWTCRFCLPFPWHWHDDERFVSGAPSPFPGQWYLFAKPERLKKTGMLNKYRIKLELFVPVARTEALNSQKSTQCRAVQGSVGFKARVWSPREQITACMISKQPNSIRLHQSLLPPLRKTQIFDLGFLWQQCWGHTKPWILKSSI